MIQERTALRPGDSASAPAERASAPSLGLIGAVAAAGALAAPGLGLALVAGGSAWGPGTVGPISVLAAALALVPTAAVFAILSRELPAAGTVGAWLAAVLSPGAGARAGGLLAAAYTSAAVLGITLFGVSIGVALAYVGLPGSGYPPYALGAVAGAVIAALLFEGGPARWVAAVAAALWVQITVGGALIVTVLAAPGGDGPVPLDAAGSGFGAGGLVLAAIALLGFEIASVVASPARRAVAGRGPSVSVPRAPRRLPAAVSPILALVSVAMFLIAGAWAFGNITQGAGAIAVPAPAEAGMAALLQIARASWGEGDVLIVLAGPAAALGLLVAAIAGASRTLDAMRAAAWTARASEPVRPFEPARGRISWRMAARTPAWLSRTRGLALLGLAAALVWPLWLPGTLAGDDGTLAAVAWWSAATAVFVFAVYLTVNAAGLLGFGGRRRTVALITGHLVLPVAGLVLSVVLLLALLAVLLGSPDARMGLLVVLFCLAVLAADAFAVLWMSGWRPQLRRPGGDDLARGSDPPAG